MLSEQITNLIDALATRFGTELKAAPYIDAKKIWSTLEVDDRKEAQSRFYMTAQEAYASRGN